ncbi:MAG TPA: SRPBCC family protein [Kofleriaceae bacterium]|jgi:uncharacterized membrane protein|nr:SRPBCC family protein [Kofleriaceae bacterium]
MTRHTPISWLLGGAVLGAASMYFLDPDRGKRRRHQAVDRARGALSDVEELAGKAERDLEHRSRGLAARVRGAPARRRGLRTLVDGTPEQRLLQGVGGGALATWGLARRGFVGAGAVIAGASLIASAAVASQDGRIRVQKTITIDAPVEEVFAFWSRFENFPRFMEHVLEVRGEGDRSLWKVAGPAGMPIEWQAEITEHIEPRKIAWRSLPGSIVDHHGEVHFERTGDQATRISVHMAYRPPGGALGHAAAGFLLGDPKTLMDEDLLRLKSLFERGKTRIRGDQVSRDDVRR